MLTAAVQALVASIVLYTCDHELRYWFLSVVIICALTYSHPVAEAFNFVLGVVATQPPAHMRYIWIRCCQFYMASLWVYIVVIRERAE